MKILRNILCSLNIHFYEVSSSDVNHCHKRCTNPGCRARIYADYGRSKFVRNDEPLQQMIIVPEAWFKSLLAAADSVDQEKENWEYGNSAANDKIHFKSVALVGYVKSANTILKYNERITK